MCKFDGMLLCLLCFFDVDVFEFVGLMLCVIVNW